MSGELKINAKWILLKTKDPEYHTRSLLKHKTYISYTAIQLSRFYLPWLDPI